MKTLAEYMNMPHNIRVVPCEEGGYVVEIPTLPGCMTQVEHAEDVMPMIFEAKRAWLEAAIELGHRIYEPAFGAIQIPVVPTSHDELKITELEDTICCLQKKLALVTATIKDNIRELKEHTHRLEQYLERGSRCPNK